MPHRRNVLKAAAGLGLAVSAQPALGQGGAEGQAGRDLIELRRYHLDNPAQRKALEEFLTDAAIPAWNRQGITPVGVFSPEKDPGPIYVVLGHRGMESAVLSTSRLLADSEFRGKAASVLDAPAASPPFKRMESTLLLAFRGIPRIERPVTSPGRVFQLRIYESPSIGTGQKKIEMFNDAGELAIFRRVGLHPVFFGEAIVGDRMPNLTYMLGFESREALDASWKRFIADPEWKALSKRPEYADKTILSGITNIVLRPTDSSQI